MQRITKTGNQYSKTLEKVAQEFFPKGTNPYPSPDDIMSNNLTRGRMEEELIQRIRDLYESLESLVEVNDYIGYGLSWPKQFLPIVKEFIEQHPAEKSDYELIQEGRLSDRPDYDN